MAIRKTVITKDGMSLISTKTSESGLKYFIGYYALAYVDPESRTNGSVNQLVPSMKQLVNDSSNVIYDIFTKDESDGYQNPIKSLYRYSLDDNGNNNLVCWRYNQTSGNYEGVVSYQNDMPIPAPLYYLNNDYNKSDLLDKTIFGGDVSSSILMPYDDNTVESTIKVPKVSLDMRTYANQNVTGNAPRHGVKFYDYDTQNTKFIDSQSTWYGSNGYVANGNNIYDSLIVLQSISNYNKSSTMYGNVDYMSKYFNVSSIKVINTNTVGVNEFATSLSILIDVNISHKMMLDGSYSGSNSLFSQKSTSFKFNRIGLYAAPATEVKTQDGSSIEIFGDTPPILFAVIDLDDTVYLRSDGSVNSFKYDVQMSIENASGDDSSVVSNPAVYYNLYNDDSISYYKNQLISNASTLNAISDLQAEIMRLKANKACEQTVNTVKTSTYGSQSNSGNGSLRNLKDSEVKVNESLKSPSAYNEVDDISIEVVTESSGVYTRASQVLSEKKIGKNSLIMGINNKVIGEKSLVFGGSNNRSSSNSINNAIINGSNSSYSNNSSNLLVSGGTNNAFNGASSSSIFNTSNSNVVNSGQLSLFNVNNMNVSGSGQIHLINSGVIDIKSSGLIFATGSRNLSILNSSNLNLFGVSSNNGANKLSISNVSNLIALNWNGYVNNAVIRPYVHASDSAIKGNPENLLFVDASNHLNIQYITPGQSAANIMIAPGVDLNALKSGGLLHDNTSYLKNVFVQGAYYDSYMMFGSANSVFTIDSTRKTKWITPTVANTYLTYDGNNITWQNVSANLNITDSTTPFYVSSNTLLVSDVDEYTGIGYAFKNKHVFKSPNTGETKYNFLLNEFKLQAVSDFNKNFIHLRDDHQMKIMLSYKHTEYKSNSPSFDLNVGTDMVEFMSLDKFVSGFTTISNFMATETTGAPDSVLTNTQYRSYTRPYYFNLEIDPIQLIKFMTHGDNDELVTNANADNIHDVITMGYYLIQMDRYDGIYHYNVENRKEGRGFFSQFTLEELDVLFEAYGSGGANKRGYNKLLFNVEALNIGSKPSNGSVYVNNPVFEKISGYVTLYTQAQFNAFKASKANEDSKYVKGFTSMSRWHKYDQYNYDLVAPTPSVQPPSYIDSGTNPDIYNAVNTLADQLSVSHHNVRNRMILVKMDNGSYELYLNLLGWAVPTFVDITGSTCSDSAEYNHWNTGTNKSVTLKTYPSNITLSVVALNDHGDI